MKRILSLLLVAVLLICAVTLVSCDIFGNGGTTNTPNCKHDDPTKVVVLDAVAPTCKETGLTEGLKCTLCGTAVIPQAIVPKAEHQFGEWGTDIAEDSIQETRECNFCGEVERRDATFDIEKSVTVQFYCRSSVFNWRTYFDEFNKFNKLYPNISIDFVYVIGYDEVYGSIVNGLQPNIAFCYPDYVLQYNNYGKVITLDQFIDSSIKITRADGSTETLGLTQAQVDDFIDGFYSEGRQFGDGLMYTLPFSKATELLYYNKTFFEANNLEVPTTWDEMETLCERIKEIDPDCIPLGYDNESNLFITLCEQFGSPYTSSVGEHYLFDNDTNRAFVKRVADWYDKGYIITMNTSGVYTSNLFTDQKSYMCIASSTQATHLRPDKDKNGNYIFKVDIARIPQVDPANSKVISVGPSLVMFDSGNTQQNIATWLFMKFLVTNAQLQADYSKALGYMPVIESAKNVKSYSDYLKKADGGDNIMALSLKKSLEQSDAYFSIPAFVGSSKARSAVGDLLVRCMCYSSSGNMDSIIDEAFKAALVKCEEK